MSNSKTKVKCGIIGCGNVAHSFYAPAIKEYGELVAACGRHEERVKSLQERFGAKEHYLDYNQMLLKADIDAVFILTGGGTSDQIVVRAAEAGKHLLVQKPLATKMEGANAAVSAVRKAGVKALAEPNIHCPAILEAKEIIDKGALGKIHWFNARVIGGASPPWGEKTYYTKGAASPLFHAGVYPISHSIVMLGPVKRIISMSILSMPQRFFESGEDHTKSLVKEGGRGHGWGPRITPVTLEDNDNTFTLMEMKNGALGCLVCNYSPLHKGHFYSKLPQGMGEEIYGEEGSLNIDGEIPEHFDYVSSKREFQPTGSQASAKISKFFPPWNYFFNSTQNLLSSIVNDTEPISTIEQGRHVAEIMIKSIESSKTGKAINITSTF